MELNHIQKKGKSEYKEIVPVYERSGSMGQQIRLVCAFDTEEEAKGFCESNNLPSHTSYTKTYLEVGKTIGLFSSWREANRDNEIIKL